MKKHDRGDPNQYGLSYVYERQWTADSYANYSAKDQVDPKVIIKDARSVVRGGNATARRWIEGTGFRIDGTNFRIVKDQ